MINRIQPDTVLPKTKKVKVYTALLTQTGTNNPTVIELQNTLGTEIIWTRHSTGAYKGTAVIPGTFTANKTWTIINLNHPTAKQIIAPASVDYISIVTLASGQIPTDGLLTLNCIEIKIYDI